MNIRSFDLDLDFGFPSGGLDGGFFGVLFYVFFIREQEKKEIFLHPGNTRGAGHLYLGESG